MSSNHESDSGAYDKLYYDNHCGAVPYARDTAAVQNHFRTLASTIVERYRPTRVLDVGCAKGFLVEHLRDAGVDAFGLDSSEYAISEVREDIKPFCKVDSGLSPLGAKYDLITCIEVAEHLTETDSEALVKNLCEHTDHVLFSSTPLDFAEDSHINIQPREYWVELFARNGFYPDLRFEPSFITPQAMSFKRMTRKLNVAIFSKEKPEWAVVRLRILDPLRELEKQGRANVTFIGGNDTELPIEKLMNADVFVIQREFAEKAYSSEVVQAAMLLNKVIVFEIDDLLTQVPRSNPVYPHSTRIAQDLIDVARDADFITASTGPLLDELAREVVDARQKGHVVRNCVNTEIWGSEFIERDRRPGDPLVVGWFGSPTHQEDLAIVKDAISYVARKYRGQVEFHFFGYLPEELENIEGVKLVRRSQPNVVLHAQGVREAKIDLAIAPLTDHPFNRSKSDLKWLEYSICSIPAIFSRVAPYENSVVQGVTGILVENTTADWVEAIERMLRDDELRQSIARNAFTEVRTSYCLDVAANTWDDLYRSFTVSGSRHGATDSNTDELAAEAASLLFMHQAARQSKFGTPQSAVTSLEASLAFSNKATTRAVATGIGLLSHARIGAGEKMLETTTAKDPCDAGSWLWLAKLYRITGDPVRAERALDAGAQHCPTDVDLALLHVDHLRETGRDSEVGPRLAPLTEVDYEPDPAVILIDNLIRIGRPQEALKILRRTSAQHPDLDFSGLTVALSRAQSMPADALGEWSPSRHRRNASSFKLAVFSADPLCGTRVQTTLAAPLRVLASAGLADTEWSDGVTRAEIAATADICVLHRAFLGGPHAARTMATARNHGKRVALMLDDMLWDHAESSVAKYAEEVDCIIVPTESMAQIVTRLAPAASDRIHVVPAMVDAEMFGGRRWRSFENRPFSIAIVTSHARPNDLRELASRIGTFVESHPGRFTLTTWSPYYDGKTDLAASKAVGSASPFYLEYAKRLEDSAPDVALIPVSKDARFEALSDQTYLEFSASRVPVIANARGPFKSAIQVGSTGFVLGDDWKSWIDGIQQLHQNPKLCRDVADRAWTITFAERTAQQNAIRFGQALASAIRVAAKPVAAMA